MKLNKNNISQFLNRSITIKVTGSPTFVEGRVDQFNDHGVKINGTWYDYTFITLIDTNSVNNESTTYPTQLIEG